MNFTFLETLVAFLIVLGLAVFVHELGHFLVAKAVGVRVLEFAFGFPPKIATLFVRNGTEYKICALPLGGYVKLAGMDPHEEAGPDGFDSKPVWARMLVYVAGPLMNFALAALIFIGMGATVGVPTRGDMIRIVGVVERGPAAGAGFRPEDRVIAIDGKKVSMDEMLATVKKSPGRPLTFTLEREERQVTLRVTPDAKPDSAGQIGVQLTPDVVYRKAGVFFAMVYGVSATWDWTRETLVNLGKVFYDREARKGVGGPVAIARLAGEAFRQGAITFFQFLAVISVNLGVINLLPLLVVDGGHIALLGLEWARGRRLQPSMQVSIQVVGMVLILLVVVLLTVRDIGMWATGTSPF
ncbi:MAG: site-2 protease family protein [Armatimonadetes bacterium]|nr:site-2 protease family protein [Armatimonadota bacterium]